jgi:hypothetical protein
MIDVILAVVGVAGGKIYEFLWAWSLKGVVGRQSFSGGCAYIFSPSNSRQLILDLFILRREYTNIDANAREYVSRKAPNYQTKLPINRKSGEEGFCHHCDAENSSPIGRTCSSETFRK